MGDYVNNNKVLLQGKVDSDDAVAEIATLLGVGRRQGGDFDGQRVLSDVCQSSNVNKNAFNKPVRHATTSEITNEQIKSVRCGLTPVTLPKMGLANISNSMLGSYTMEQCLAEIREWSYLQPRGIAGSEWNRLKDFNGYNHDAIPADGDWSEIEIDRATIDRLRNAVPTISNTGEYTGYNFKINSAQYNGQTVAKYYTQFSMKLGLSSSQYHGTVTNREIPLEYLAINGNTRLALAVWLPNFNNNKGAWGFFVGSMTIEQYFKEGKTDKSLIFPNMVSNQEALRLIQEKLDASGGYYKFTAVPILVDNIGYSTANSMLSLTIQVGITNIYCMPSGALQTYALCGNIPAPKYWEIYTDTDSTRTLKGIRNIDTQTHTFDYVLVIINDYVAGTPTYGSVTLNGGELRVIGGNAVGPGKSVALEVTHQDGVEV